MCALCEQRGAGEYDEEALKLTRGVLSSNPDELTLWNYRKDIFLKMRQSRYYIILILYATVKSVLLTIVQIERKQESIYIYIYIS